MSVNLSHRFYGNGPPMVILHGLFGSAANWNSIARRLTDDHPVYAVDLRNHGGSPHASAMGYLEMARDVVALLDTLGLPKAALLGHSMGGKVAMTVALSHPERVSHLIVVDVAPIVYEHEYDLVFDALERVDPDTLASREQADRILAETIDAPALRAFLLQNLRKVHGNWRWRINLQAIWQNLPALVGFPTPELAGCTCSCPALFVGGAQSDYLQRQHHDVVHRYFPKAQIRTLAEAGHWLHVERPDELIRLVRGFMADSSGP